MKKKLLTTAVLVLGVSTGAQASLVARAGGMVYDDVNNLTWTADANLFKTQAASNANLVSQIIAANNGVIHDTANTSDTPANSGTYNLTIADFTTSNGQMTWWGAQAWANNLTLGDVKGWSLPVEPTGTNTTSQMGDLFHTQLGAVLGSWNDEESITNPTTYNANYNLFTNIKQSDHYWSSSEENVNAIGYDTSWIDPGSYTKGNRFYAWAVHTGDVAAVIAPAAVPLPGTVWLFLTGLIGLPGLKRRKNIG